MKVFISWSGERSRLVAELLHTWIQCVIQAVDPWVSSSDIDRGSLWFSQIINELSSTTHGIICITNDNKEKPWILFEAGALAKGLASSRIYTFLVDLNPEDIRDPLAQFNHTRPNKNDVFKLISSINSGLELNRLKESVLGNVFETYWPQFEASFKKIIDDTAAETPPEKPRPQEDLLNEILISIRSVDKRVRRLETNGANKVEYGGHIGPYDISAAIADGIMSVTGSSDNSSLVDDIPFLKTLIRQMLKHGLSDEEILATVGNNYKRSPNVAKAYLIAAKRSVERES